MSALTRALNALYLVVDWTAHALMVALFVIVNLGVISRYVFNSPFVWTEEVALFVLSWMVFLAASLLVRDWEHLRVTYFIEKLPAPVLAAVEMATKVLILAFLVYMLVVAARVIPEVGPWEHSPALDIPMHIPMMSVVAGLALMIAQLAGLILELVLASSKKREG